MIPNGVDLTVIGKWWWDENTDSPGNSGATFTAEVHLTISKANETEAHPVHIHNPSGLTTVQAARQAALELIA